MSSEPYHNDTRTNGRQDSGSVGSPMLRVSQSENDVVPDMRESEMDEYFEELFAPQIRTRTAIAGSFEMDETMDSTGNLLGLFYNELEILDGAEANEERLLPLDDDEENELAFDSTDGMDVEEDVARNLFNIDDVWRREDAMGTLERETIIDITAEQVAAGIDIQGVPWGSLPFGREEYRNTRLSAYKNYENMPQDTSLKNEIKANHRKDAKFFRFYHNTRRAKCTVVHFQLRNLVWATSERDVYLVYKNDVMHWDAVRKRVSRVLNLSGNRRPSLPGVDHGDDSRDSSTSSGFETDLTARPMLTDQKLELLREEGQLSGFSPLGPELLKRKGKDRIRASSAQARYPPSTLSSALDYFRSGFASLHGSAFESRADDLLGRQVQVSTIAVNHNICVAGGFFGEVVAKELSTGKIMHNARVTLDDNAITNALEVYLGPSGIPRVMACNNDCCIRVFDVPTFTLLKVHEFGWPVNHATRQPGNQKLMCVVGDDSDVILADGETGKVLHQLKGHRDYSFATAWHPNGYLVATGNQDTTARVFDIRYISKDSKPVCVIGGHMGAIRSVRFSNDGDFLALGEPADFVHVYDARKGLFDQCQEIDLFGEIAGFSFSPHSDSLFVGLFDNTYGSLLEYERLHSW
mmetsp:Transcript_3852/g.6727  ORF Transcript_3852/g.6727 Transcript_3852/m.6727 type:complete len:636 (-) Transcript_3852:222-2129(-)|eukprot:CAMPEP_0182450454 /NCGR_PEP_ID=MMETSP1172-20130603/41322_1 /TAXON_ID=708627 /ORGANISM="Timspurckia oligopyrenoides, Strain CCMP3278" /LENGTH=635 /DNA_ID=CAMNT_0024648069 /DNA_START=147 /DNA_END=2054 /DNA_ORIENTATION=-